MYDDHESALYAGVSAARNLAHIGRYREAAEVAMRVSSVYLAVDGGDGDRADRGEDA